MFNMFLIMPAIMFLFIFGIFIFIIMSVVKNNKKTQKQDETIMKYNADVITKYEKLVSSMPSIDNIRKKASRTKYIVILVFVIMLCIPIFLSLTRSINNFRYISFLIPLLFVFIIVFAIKNSSGTKKYKEFYKKTVIPAILKEFKSSLSYDMDKAMDKALYNESKLDIYDTYSSNDTITGTLCGKKFIMSDIHTQDRDTDKDGHTSYTTSFHGCYAVMDIDKKIDLTMEVLNNRGSLERIKKVDTDNSVFNKQYSVYSTDEIIALRILTPDVLDKIVLITEKSGYSFDIKIKNNKLYLRFYCDLFEPSYKDNKSDAVYAYKYITILDNIELIVKEIFKLLDELEV